MLKYAFWNNKGGTGKTSLTFQALLAYAEKNPNKRILAMDLCPQANLSELLLGGLIGGGSQKLLQLQQKPQRPTVGGYFQMRLPQPYTAPKFTPQDFIVSPSAHNNFAPKNIDLLSGDPLLELQSNAVSTLANAQIPGQNSWLAIIDWLKDFTDLLVDTYDVAFIDCNPSFSIFTQIALSVADRLILPVMADDSSRRALQNAFSLIYGLHLPSEIYAQHSFSTRLVAANRSLPKVHLIIKNRLTQYMGPASAYDAVLRKVEDQVATLLASHPSIFTFSRLEDGLVNTRDFGTTGVVAFAQGKSFSKLNSGVHDISGRPVTVKEEYRVNAEVAVNEIVMRL